ncbi:hypothetical protein Tco_0452184 [Tanacetum coccineum]
METARSWIEAKLQEGRLPELTKAKAKVGQIHPPHKNTKRNYGFAQREVQASSANDNPGRKKKGHNTDECMHLKKQIEEMLKAGKLSHLIKELKQNNGKEQPKAAKKRETFGKDKALAILMVQPWERVARNKVHTKHFLLTQKFLYHPLGSVEAHKMLKALVEGGVITLKSSMMVPLECVMVSRPEGNLPATKQTVEERIKKPVDMTGVPRHIAEHRLNVRDGCSPVRQKKRGQAANKNQAIQEEVGKLVEEGIMKEVHYHDWLSNPVMVKKHNDSWRVCVDFKDLNKSCSKDGYLLSEID